MTTIVKEKPPVYIQDQDPDVKHKLMTVCYEFTFFMPKVAYSTGEMSDSEIIEASSRVGTYDFLDNPGEDVYDGKGT